MTGPSPMSAVQEHSQDKLSPALKLVVAVTPRALSEEATSASSSALYWIKVPHVAGPLSDRDREILTAVLTDPLLETIEIFEENARHADLATRLRQRGVVQYCEKQYLPGVTDNLSHTIEEALRLKKFGAGEVSVCSGRSYCHKESMANRESDAKYKLFHPLIEKFVVHDLLDSSSSSGSGSGAGAAQGFLLFPERAEAGAPAVEYINLEIDDSALMQLSSERTLALSLAELKAIQFHYSEANRGHGIHRARHEAGLADGLTDVELEIISQTWSEHCKHKIFGANITHEEYDEASENDEPVEIVDIESLYKTYIQAPTHELSKKRDDLLSVFEDNSGVVKWSDTQAVCFKVETHNSPSALEPYGGALTGILGVNRDILGTGLGARPIFNTDVFCFAYPSDTLPERPKLLPAKTILDGVRLGVEDGGNKSGIPTVNGAICFHDGYRAKPLVFCGTGGILPLSVAGQIGYLKHTKVGDRIVMAGGRIGKDGVHGATFSSESLNENSPVQAVQIGDPFTQKRLLDFVLEARDQGLITGLTDNGAGGLSSSIGEMATITGGATIELENIPLKYPGLADWEIVVSESQERMSLSTRDFAAMAELAKKYNVEVTDIGEFRADGYFRVTRGGRTVALLDLDFLHKGVPKLELKSRYQIKKADTISSAARLVKPQGIDNAELLTKLLAHPNICSRENIIRRYDHEVQGASVIKPLMGPRQMAPCDSAVIKPVPEDAQGLVISNGLCPQLSQFDGYLMAICAADEAVRNAVCTGVDPDSMTLLDNFCWTDPVPGPRNPDAEAKLAILVRACMGLADICRAYGAPLISGKDSMKNDFDDGVIRLSVPPTLLVSGMGKIPDAANAISMEFKQPGDLIYLLSAGSPSLAGAAAQSVEPGLCFKDANDIDLPTLNVAAAARMYRVLHKMIGKGFVHSAHDLSEGGLLVALAESSLASACGADIRLDGTLVAAGGSEAAALFGEGPGRIVISVAAATAGAVEKEFMAIGGVSCYELGVVTGREELKILIEGESHPIGRGLTLSNDQLRKAWQTPLPFN